MFIFSGQEEKNTQEAPASSSFWIRLLKQTLVAVGVSAAMLVMYLMVVNEPKEDDIAGKFAYKSKDGAYVGVVQGRGRKSGIKVYYIKQGSSIISMDERYVTIKDNAPNYSY
jgi:hypothetical protein